MVREVRDKVNARVTERPIAPAGQTVTLHNQRLFSAVAGNLPDFVRTHSAGKINESISGFDWAGAAPDCQLNRRTCRVRNFPDLRSVGCATGGEEDPFAVTRPAGDKIVRARVRHQFVGRASRQIPNEDLAMLFGSVVESDATA